jgi:hypothetical protein
VFNDTAVSICLQQQFNKSLSHNNIAGTISDPCYPLSRPLLVSDYSGTIQSNNYPSRFWGYSDCSWLIESQEPGGVSVKPVARLHSKLNCGEKVLNTYLPKIYNILQLLDLVPIIALCILSILVWPMLAANNYNS